MHRPAILALEDGRVFSGRAAGAITRRGGEVVFNTSLTGYQEVFTDPSYAGQIVCLTYPHIGNVGANLDDEEASRPYIESLIVREFSEVASNWRSAESAQLYLNRHKIPVLWDIDTRALVRHIRKVGALRGIVSTDGTAADQLIFEAKQLPLMAGQELAGRVSCSKAYDWQKGSIELATSPWAEQMGSRRPAPTRANSRLSPTITASSRTFFACWSIITVKLRWFRQTLRRRMFSHCARMACFFPMAQGIPSPSLTRSITFAN